MKYKIIHQSWSNKFLPIKFKKNQLVLKKYFKDCEFKLWTDDDNKNFIKNEFPDFYPIYDNYKNKINQVDSARFFYLYKYGGLYIDLDVLLTQNIKCLLDEDCCLFSQDSNKSYYATKANLPFFIDSMCMYSKPGNNFIGEIIKHLYKNEPINIVNALDNVFLTGPGMVTNLYNKLKPTIKLNHNKIIVKDDLELYDNIYGIHYCTNTWVGKKYILNK
tara:strand:- start:509 stop:1162 length:654 start_codon:yes stop_codon:yes gene_type:complete